MLPQEKRKSYKNKDKRFGDERQQVGALVVRRVTLEKAR